MVQEKEVTIVDMTSTTAITKYVIDAWDPAREGGTGNSGTDVLADVNGDGAMITHYVPGDQPDQVYGRYDTSLTSDAPGIYFLETDQNGSIRDILDHTGAIDNTVSYDAYGNVLDSGGEHSEFNGDYLFDGYRYDQATQFYDDRARIYDPVTQRWITQDPLGFDAGDSNLYRYVNNSPMDNVDPSGYDRQPNSESKSEESGGTRHLAKYAKPPKVDKSRRDTVDALYPSRFLYPSGSKVYSWCCPRLLA